MDGDTKRDVLLRRPFNIPFTIVAICPVEFYQLTARFFPLAHFMVLSMRLLMA